MKRDAMRSVGLNYTYPAFKDGCVCVQVNDMCCICTAGYVGGCTHLSVLLFAKGVRFRFDETNRLMHREMP